MDDEQLILDIVRAFLDHLGYDSETVTDGEAALERYAAASDDGRPFDMVLMDIEIPDGIGADAAIKELRKHDPMLKAVVMSGLPDHPLILNPLEAGCLCPLAKPFSMAQLDAALDQVLRSGKARSPVPPEAGGMARQGVRHRC
jgi:DNA-binding response OmpR family regulator